MDYLGWLLAIGDAVTAVVRFLVSAFTIASPVWIAALAIAGLLHWKQRRIQPPRMFLPSSPVGPTRVLVDSPLTHPLAIEAARRAAQRVASGIHHHLAKRVTSLATISSAAPLFGLFGTVTGIVAAFRGCSGDASFCRAATISSLGDALIPLALSLTIALPTLWSYQYLRTRLDELDLAVQCAITGLINNLSLRYPS